MGRVNDKRQKRGKRYTLAILLLVVILTKLCGENTHYGIPEWEKMRGNELQRIFCYRRDVTLLEDAIRMSHVHHTQTVAMLNNFVIAFASYLGLYNLPSARRFFQAKFDSLLFTAPSRL